MRLLSILFIGLLTISTHSFAMQVNEMIPHNLDLKDQNWKQQSFDTLSGEKGLVLFFIRSVNWCPYCQAQLIDLNKRIKEFNHQGYNVVALSYDPIGSLERFATQRRINFTLLSDPKSEAIKSFGLLNTSIKKGSPHYGIPNPAVVVIGRDKMVKTIYQEDGYKKRPDLDEILRSLVYIEYDKRQNQ